MGGVLKLPDGNMARGGHLIRISRGDVRLYRTRLEGPQGAVNGWQSALLLAGSGDPAADKAQTCALNECTILSNKAGIVLDGVGCRLAMHNGLIVANEALQLLPGANCKGRPSIQCVLQRNTFAVRQAV